jgi:hypothetical protein
MEHSPSTGSAGIIDLLRQTIRRLEATTDFRQDDPAVIFLKRNIVQSIAELEVIKDSAPGTESENTGRVLSQQ